MGNNTTHRIRIAQARHQARADRSDAAMYRVLLQNAMARGYDTIGEAIEAAPYILPTLDTARVFRSVFTVVMGNGYADLHEPAELSPSELREQLALCIAETFDALGMPEPPAEEMAPWHNLIDAAFPEIAQALDDTTDEYEDDDAELCGECGDELDHDRLMYDGQCEACARAAIPRDFPVIALPSDHDCPTAATCNSCGLSWDDSIATAYTPAPAGRCPFEQFHRL